jgi:tetratricopeptide (TPR) repeat protein
MENASALLLLGLIYTIILGGLTWLRREGLSAQFAIESITLTVVVSGVVFLTQVQFHPALFVILLYLVTMRIRLLVDWANNMARKGDFSDAERFYEFTFRLFPDPISKLMIKVNQGVCWLQQRKLDEAILVFIDILNKENEGDLGIKYKAATHYNLAVAYRRKGMESQAIVEFNRVLDVLPASVYAHRAEAALNREKHFDTDVKDDMTQDDVS